MAVKIVIGKGHNINKTSDWWSVGNFQPNEEYKENNLFNTT